MSAKDDLKCKELRKQIFITGYSGGMAHLASSFSSVEIIYTLYMKDIMRFDSKNPCWSERDRFVLSKGHAGLALYSILEMAGYITKGDLYSYLKPFCHIGGEPNVRDAAGIEASTGSLGHGLSIAIGMAMAQKLDINGARTFVLIGDGECQEGSIWEAAMSATAFSLDNLVVILDSNNVQKTNHIKETMRYVSWDDKWKSFGWNVIEADGHDVDNLQRVFKELPVNGKPTIIKANTIKGKGVSVMEDNPKWHFKLPNGKQLKIFMEELGISKEELEV